MMTTLHTSLTCLIILSSSMMGLGNATCLALAYSVSIDPPPTKVVSPVPAAQENATTIQLTDIILAPVEGFTDEADYQESQLAFTNDIVEKARQSNDPAEQAQLWLVAANLTLAYRVEAACTRELLRLPAKRQAEQSVSNMLESVDAYLDHATNIATETQSEEPANTTDWPAKTLHKVRVLKAFASAIRAILLFDQIDDITKTMRSAASDLSIWMEDDDEQIAVAAVLWHAALRGHEFRLSPAMQVLPLATEELQRHAQPFSFYSRLLRCMILADHSHYATSMALLTKLEDRCERWFTNEQDREQALRAISVVEIEVLGLWRDHLTKPQQNISRKWCEERISTLLTERFQASSLSVLRLRPAIPIIAADTHHRQPDDVQTHPTP